MRIVMMTNTFLPMVGGVSRSVAWFSEAFRQAGHRVLVVAPEFDGGMADEADVVRVPAIRNFNGSDFSIGLPLPGTLLPVLEDFGPQVIHAHHPFLLGDTALRAAARFNVPAVFTHHTMYEQYTHYVPGDSEAMRQFAIRLATEFANLCDQVIAPSESVAAILCSRGVASPIATVPTGIDTAAFAAGDRSQGRAELGLPEHAAVVGHVGRLAAEKNLSFLAAALAAAARQRPTFTSWWSARARPPPRSAASSPRPERATGSTSPDGSKARPWPMPTPRWTASASPRSPKPRGSCSPRRWPPARPSSPSMPPGPATSSLMAATAGC